MIYDHADHILDGSTIDMRLRIIHVRSESVLQSADYSVDCRLNRYIPVCHTNRRSTRNTIGAIMNRLVGMGLKISDPLSFFSGKFDCWQALFDIFNIFKSQTTIMHIPFDDGNMSSEFGDQIFHTLLVGLLVFIVSWNWPLRNKTPSSYS